MLTSNHTPGRLYFNIALFNRLDDRNKLKNGLFININRLEKVDISEQVDLTWISQSTE